MLNARSNTISGIITNILTCLVKIDFFWFTIFKFLSKKQFLFAVFSNHKTTCHCMVMKSLKGGFAYLHTALEDYKECNFNPRSTVFFKIQTLKIFSKCFFLLLNRGSLCKINHVAWVTIKYCYLYINVSRRRRS